MPTSITLALMISFAVSIPSVAQGPAGKSEVEQTIATFEQGLREHKLALIETAVADDIVVLENGERNDGWKDFRDNHLVPEMQEPASPSNTELIKTSVKGEMAWGYCKTTIETVRYGNKAKVVVWSAYVLERRTNEWKIVLLNWSVGR